MPDPGNPALYQINTRVWMTELSRESLGRAANLDDVPDRRIGPSGRDASLIGSGF